MYFLYAGLNRKIISKLYILSNQSMMILVGIGRIVYGSSLRLRYGKIKNIIMLDSIYDQNVLNQLRSNCDYISGHSAGTNPSLVRYNLGLPILCYDVNYNVETTKNAALYFKTSDDIINIINETNRKELAKISKKMKKIAKDNYTWEQISQQYKLLFEDK